MGFFLALAAAAAAATAAAVYYVVKSKPLASAEKYALSALSSAEGELAKLPSIKNGLNTIADTEKVALYKTLPSRMVSMFRDDDGESEVFMLQDPGTPGILNALIAVYGGNTLIAPKHTSPFSFLVKRDDATGKTLLMAVTAGAEKKFAGFYDGTGWEVFLLPGEAVMVGQAAGVAPPALP